MGKSVRGFRERSGNTSSAAKNLQGQVDANGVPLDSAGFLYDNVIPEVVHMSLLVEINASRYIQHSSVRPAFRSAV